MASSMRSHRAIAVGISGGFGLALPFFAYLATLPFGDTSNAVRADAVPFAAGALAGVGLMALSSYLIDASAAEDDAAEQGSAKPEAASRTPVRAARASETSVLKGVPIITRAVDALDEEEAWAEIDAMFAEDSPISCDPVHSKDMYQIAFEELQRAEHERAAAAASHRAASPQATATQGTSAQPAAAQQTAARSQPVRAAAHVTAAETGRLGVSAPATASTAVPAAASTAAFAALVETASAVPSSATPASNETESRAAARDRAAAMASLGASAVAGPAAAPSALGASVAAPSASPVPAAAAPQAVEEVVYTVPVADYSGHEAMWEAAVAILEELDAPSASAAAPAAPSPAVTAQMDARRMAELAEDGCIERDHRRVDEILEEEFDRVDSKSVRNTTHEYLRVIQGGTAAMPRLKAEA